MAYKKINKTCHCTGRLPASIWLKRRNKLRIKKVFFQPIIDFPQKCFEADFDLKHGFKMVTKGQSTLGLLPERIVECHVLDKIKDHWQPTNPHCTTMPRTTKQPARNRLTPVHILTLNWKKASIFKNLPTSVHLQWTKSNPVLSSVVFCNHKFVYSSSKV